MAINIALVGDFNKDVIAHRAINASVAKASPEIGCEIAGMWISTEKVEAGLLDSCRAVWCVPGSPYQSTEGALAAIRHARERCKPFLGTCGGYQHAALEYARHVLGYPLADNAEVDPKCKMPLITGLRCRLVEKNDKIIIQPGTKLADIYGGTESDEEYHCSYGVNADYLNIFDGSDMIFSARDVAGEPRALELGNHPFYFGTAFQPERTALAGKLHPIVKTFFSACLPRA